MARQGENLQLLLLGQDLVVGALEVLGDLAHVLQLAAVALLDGVALRLPQQLALLALLTSGIRGAVRGRDRVRVLGVNITACGSGKAWTLGSGLGL